MRNYDAAKWQAYKPKQLELRRKRVENGLCKHCDKSVIEGKNVCTQHEAMHRSHYLKKMYNITNEQYDILLEKHNGRCWICGWSQTQGKRRLSVDHDHKTGMIRGLLCYTCNKGIGVFRDRSDVLLQASQYLQNNWAAHNWQVPGNYKTTRAKHTGVNKGVF